jgi:FkbM family methyltransferase
VFGNGPAILEKKILNLSVKIPKGDRELKEDYDDAWIYALMTQSKDMFDVGCNNGFFTLLACLTSPSRKVVAADANPKVLSVAAEMLFLNGISEQVQFVLGFLSDKEDEEKEFYSTGSGEAGSMYSSHAKSAAAIGSKILVKTTTIDRVLERTGILPELIKMDIEGAEKFALEGAKKLASSHKSRFVVEVHSNPQLSMKENGEAILNWCQSVGHSAYYLKHHTKLDSVDPIVHRGRCHLLLQPSDWKYPEYLNEIQQNDTLEKAHGVLQQHGLV